MISQPIHVAFVHPQPDPVAFSIGHLGIHWYGLMYLLGFFIFYRLACYRAGRSPWEQWTRKKIEDLLFWGVVGVIVGGRLGFVLFYQLSYFLDHPLEVLYIHQGGMSFHGGMIGVIVVMWLWGRHHGIKFLEVADFCAPMVPVGLATGRIGNFINGELVGRPTDVPWAMVFPQIDNIPRHPSQLYQFALEGLLLFAFLWWFSSKKRPRGAVSAAFHIGYGLLRFLAEFTRQPDVYVGYLAGHLTMGQYLSLPMIIFGIILGWWSWHRHRLSKTSLL